MLHFDTITVACKCSATAISTSRYERLVELHRTLIEGTGAWPAVTPLSEVDLTDEVAFDQRLAEHRKGQSGWHDGPLTSEEKRALLLDARDSQWGTRTDASGLKRACDLHAAADAQYQLARSMQRMEELSLMLGDVVIGV